MSTQPDAVVAATAEHNMQGSWPSIDETCCGRCPGATCYVDFLTGERS